MVYIEKARRWNVGDVDKSAGILVHVCSSVYTNVHKNVWKMLGIM